MWTGTRFVNSWIKTSKFQHSVKDFPLCQKSWIQAEFFWLFWPKRRGRLTRIIRLKPHRSEFRLLTDLCQSVCKWVCYIQIDLSVVNLIVGDDFPDISNQKLPISMGYILNDYSAKGFYILAKGLLRTATRIAWSPL